MRKLHWLRIALVLAGATIVHAQTYNVLHNFGTSGGDPTDPRYSGTISQSQGGYLVTSSDDHWSGSVGSLFRIAPNGTLTVLHHFGGAASPAGGLILATDSNFYGTTQNGGTYEQGTIFRMTAQGAVTTLYNFTGGTDGGWPNAAPIQSIGGDFYGTTVGQDGQNGSVYKLTCSGKFTVLHSFATADGTNPYGPLVQKEDGYFYGTTFNGGTQGLGTIFRISASGDFKVLFNFDGTHGGQPYAPLLEASDGNLYGVATTGGTSGVGVVFKMDRSHNVSVLWSFTGGSDGSNPVGGLVQATDGWLYGTNEFGGDEGWGVLFRITPAGNFNLLRPFDSDTGASPQTALIQHTNGRLYGDTTIGGTAGDGVFYSYDMGLQPFVTFLGTGGKVGAQIEILGQGFTGTTAVSVNGVPGKFVVRLSTYLTATVPKGATSGYITVTTPSGTLKSNRKFLVWP
jgi:uncharacterized repeat protein (TIGR03803 family)